MNTSDWSEEHDPSDHINNDEDFERGCSPRRFTAAALFLIFTFVSFATLFSRDAHGQAIEAPTRTTPYDWQCQDKDGNKLSDHQRFDTALVACMNNTQGDHVTGGTYRLNRKAQPCPAKPADESRSQTCPTGTVGTWTQSRTFSSSPAPQCWTAGEWLPSSPSAGACTTPPEVDTTAPSKPTLTARVEGTTVRLSWTSAADDVAEYQIIRCTGATCTNFSLLKEVGGNTLETLNTNIPAGTTVRYRIRAKDEVPNYGAYSDVVTVTITEAPPPPPLTANPLGIAFNATTNVQLYAKPTGVVIAGRCTSHSSHPDYAEVRAKGGEVLQYLIPMERPDSIKPLCAMDVEYYRNGDVPLWPYPTDKPGSRVKWPGTHMTDMRPGGPWILHTVAYVEKLMREGKVDGVFLDAIGARPYGQAQWETWSTEEKNAWTAGNVDLVRRLDAKRRAINPHFIIVNNNVWDRGDKDPAGFEGEKHVNGVMIEHQPASATWHRNYVAKPFGNPATRRVFVIASCPKDSQGVETPCDRNEEARKWASVTGVTHVSAQTSPEYKNPLEPAVPFRQLDDRVPPPSGTASLSWIAPTQNTDGTALKDLAGFRIAYGTSPSALHHSVDIQNPSLSSYIVTGLAPGTYYFAVKAYTSGGAESALSNIASKTL